MEKEALIDAERIEKMSAMLRELVQALVDAPEAVLVSAVTEGDQTDLQIKVARSDLGTVVGKQGRTARALHNIVSAASMKLHHRFALEILEKPEL